MKTDARSTSPWIMTARGDRIDWKMTRDTISLTEVATRLLGPAPGRRGGGAPPVLVALPVPC